MILRRSNSSLQHLAGLPLFAGLAPGHLAELAVASRVLELPAQQALIRAGEPVRVGYCLLSGAVQRTRLLDDGSEKLVELVSSPQLIAMGEFFGRRSYACGAETLTDSVVLKFAAPTLRRVARKDGELSARLIEAIAQKQYLTEFEAVNRSAQTVAQRLLGYLVDMAPGRLALAGETTVNLGSSKKLIASSLGMTPESLSRGLHQLAESGAIVVSGRKVHIQNAALAIGGDTGNPQRPASLVAGAEARPSAASLINLCGRQRMLSQRMLAAWIRIGRKLAPAAAMVMLRRLSNQFECELTRLQQLQLRGAFAQKLAELQQRWLPYRQALLTEAPGLAGVDRVVALSESVLEAADQLTRAAEQRCGTAAARRINIAGRNRMLSQRLTRLHLLRAWGAAEQAADALIGNCHREFDANLAELHASAADTPEILAQLGAVADQWQHFRHACERMARHDLRKKQAQDLLNASDQLLRPLETAVKLYERLAA